MSLKFSIIFFNVSLIKNSILDFVFQVRSFKLMQVDICINSKQPIEELCHETMANQSLNKIGDYMMKNVYCIIGFVLTCMLTVTIFGCDPDVDDSIEEDGPLSQVDSEKDRETSVEFVSANPSSGGTIRVNSEIKVFFDETPKNVSVNKGKVEQTSDKGVTIKGPFDPGSLVLEVKWEGGSKTLKYDVKGAVYNRAEPSSGFEY